MRMAERSKNEITRKEFSFLTVCYESKQIIVNQRARIKAREREKVWMKRKIDSWRLFIRSQLFLTSDNSLIGNTFRSRKQNEGGKK